MQMKTIIALALLSATTALAQDMSKCPMHAEHTTIKSLSEKEVSDYLAGAGMGFGRTGELNGYPGPKHVLELSDRLSISPEQKAKLEAAMKVMRESASRLGAELVAKEKELDRRFASGSIDRASMEALTAEIGRLQGQLRSVHLAAHLEGKAILTEAQVSRYMEARGHTGHH